jgi:hypothetical protein
MPETVVPYPRFLEIRERRERVVAALTKQTRATGSAKHCVGPRLRPGVGPRLRPALALGRVEFSITLARDRDA